MEGKWRRNVFRQCITWLLKIDCCIIMLMGDKGGQWKCVWPQGGHIKDVCVLGLLTCALTSC